MALSDSYIAHLQWRTSDFMKEGIFRLLRVSRAHKGNIGVGVLEWQGLMSSAIVIPELFSFGTKQPLWENSSLGKKNWFKCKGSVETTSGDKRWGPFSIILEPPTIFSSSKIAWHGED